MSEDAGPSLAQMLKQLRRANEVAQRALAMGRHPFGATLVGPDHETVLAEQVNIDTVQHAEATLIRSAALNFTADTLWRCTLYTTFEPCAMCTGTAYWANVGRIVYGASEEKLLAMTGNDPQNPTLALPCRDVLARGQKPIAVHGPFDELEDEMEAPHRGFWSGAFSPGTAPA